MPELGVGLVRLESEADRSAWVFDVEPVMSEPVMSEPFVHWDWSQCSRWDSRYADVLQGDGERTTGERTFDWIAPADDVLADLNARAVALDARVLDAGCGNSTFCEVAAAAGGFARLVGVDYSRPVVEAMAARALERGLDGRVCYCCADVGRMPYEDGSFDVIVDKGCCDAALTAWDHCAMQRRLKRPVSAELDERAERAAALAASFVREYARVLRGGGTLLLYSYEQPSGRACWFAEQRCWRVHQQPARDGNYLYECTRVAEVE